MIPTKAVKRLFKGSAQIRGRTRMRVKSYHKPIGLLHKLTDAVTAEAQSGMRNA
jgi:hypothetical protein